MSLWKKWFGNPARPEENVNQQNEWPVEKSNPADIEKEIETEIETELSVEGNKSEEIQEMNSEIEPVMDSIEPDESKVESESVSEDIADGTDQTETEAEAEAEVQKEVVATTPKLTEENISEIREEEIPPQPELTDEEKLELELVAAAKAAEAAQLESEQQQIFEDLSVLDGRVLPELKVPDWREELEFVKERYEPCDLSDHIVKVSKRRLTARQIDHELAQSRLTAYERYLERASRRFKDKIDEDALLNKALSDLTQWKSEQAKSVAWLLADRVNQEVLKAKQAELDATSFVENNTEFVNPTAIDDYRHFARRIFLIPIVTMYIMSVVSLTYSRFEWIMKFFPLFNLGLSKFLYMVAGVASYFLLANFWRYSRKVARIQTQLVAFNSKYQEQEKRIRHAVKEHTRLSQQQPLLEPILQVLAKAYRVQLESDVMAKVHATTEFDTASLPACVTLARANNNEEDKMARLKKRALGVLMTPGWRTNGLNEIARVHADTMMLDVPSLSLSSLDTDSMVSAESAQRILLEAFSNKSIHDRVSKERLVKAIKEIHREVLANFNSDDRPRVISLRNDGYDRISFRTSWLVEDDGSESWIPFLSEVLTEETAPFGLFNILDKRSELNMPDRIKSVAVVPHYFPASETSLKVEHSKSTEVMPLDVVVRVDVSPWAEPNAFAVFANDLTKPNNPINEGPGPDSTRIGGMTGA